MITIYRSEDIRPDLLHRHGTDFFSVMIFGWQKGQRVYQCDGCKQLLVRGDLVPLAKAKRLSKEAECQA